MTAPEKLSSRDFLLEHCDAPGCTNGLVKRPDGSLGFCAVCNGTTRRLRHTHDAASGIDAPESPETLHAAQYAGTAAEPFARAFGAWAGDEVPALLDGSYVVPNGALAQLALARIAELARVVRDPTNSEPLKQLLDAIDEVTRA